jgi:hypothetical protein
MDALTVCILEDDPERTAAFRKAMTGQPFDLVILDNAPGLLSWLDAGLARTVLISLDHDLGPSRLRADARFEPGSGREVADWLAARPARCPVVVHSANGLAVPGMLLVLEQAGWVAHRVFPSGGLEWIAEECTPTVIRALGLPPARLA